MDDPRELPVPEGATEIEKIIILARDLAYGYNVGDWEHHFFVHGMTGRQSWDCDGEGANKLADYFRKKWFRPTPSVSMLEHLGYVYERTSNNYDLTPQALNLLNEPFADPRAFISYRRRESSPFALYIEARLKYVGMSNPFLDKNLRGGQKWHALLQERVEGCDYMICLIGPTTLESCYVREELKWAHDAGCVIIPICHNSYTLDKAIAAEPILADYHGHEIKEPASAADYEAAANFVLNSMEYPTY